MGQSDWHISIFGLFCISTFNAVAASMTNENNNNTISFDATEYWEKLFWLLYEEQLNKQWNEKQDT